MKIKEIIEILKQMPQEEELNILYDGAMRARIDKIWISITNHVIVGNNSEYIYDYDDRPLKSPKVDCVEKI